MRIIREPLFHFLALGALLFGAYSWLNPGASVLGSRSGTVHVTRNDVAWLAETWARQHEHPPTREELLGLVTEYLKEELLAQEARAMGLDQDDLIMRRRLAQKVQFVLQDTPQPAEPTDEDLRRIYEADADRFQTPAKVSFIQIYFSREHRRDAAADAKAALAKLSHSAGSRPPPLIWATPSRLMTRSTTPISKPCPGNLARSSHAPFSPSDPARGTDRLNRPTVFILSGCPK